MQERLKAREESVLVLEREGASAEELMYEDYFESDLEIEEALA